MRLPRAIQFLANAICKTNYPEDCYIYQNYDGNSLIVAAFNFFKHATLSGGMFSKFYTFRVGPF